MKPTLHAQTFAATVAHPTTLADAVLWDYEVTLEVDHATTVAFILNDDALSESSPKAQVAPASPDTSERRSVRLERLHVLHAQRARVDVEGVSFPAPLQPFLERNERFVVGGSVAPLDAHLATLLQDLIGDSPFASHELSLECFYSYPVAASPDVLEAVPVVLPVLLVTRQEVERSSITTLAGQCADAIQEWRTNERPREEGASLVFRVTFWPVGAPDAPPLLTFSHLTLAVSDLA